VKHTKRYFLALLLAGAIPHVSAHHSYAMFDDAHTKQVQGVVAKLEWINPHVYVWVYVKDAKAPTGFTAYAFENGSINVLSNRGWTKSSLKPGDSVTVSYWPLRDGRPGGHFMSATFPDGRELKGAGGPRGVDGTLPSAAGDKP
jgi:hypothetical protein